MHIKHYDFSKRPLKPRKFWMFLAREFAIKPRLKGMPVTVEKINMEGIEPPYLLLATHASMLDYPLMYTAIRPHNANNVVAIDAVRDVGDFFMRRLGCITKRKFVKDYNLIRHMRYCADRYHSIVCVYPEARYSFDGTTSYIPQSVAKMAKLMKVPLVALRMYGTFVAAPQWNKPEQKIPLRAELECLATAEVSRGRRRMRASKGVCSATITFTSAKTTSASQIPTVRRDCIPSSTCVRIAESNSRCIRAARGFGAPPAARRGR